MEVLDEFDHHRQVDEMYLSAYFGPQSDYYLARYKAYREGGRKFSFNLSAFFLGLLWFVYRKMYVEGVILLMSFFLVDLFTNLILTILHATQDARWIVAGVSLLVASFTYSGVGNYLYFRKAERKIYTVVHSKEQQDKIETLRLIGGTSFTSVWVTLALFILFMAFAANLTPQI